MAQQLVGVLVQHLVQVSGDHGARIHHGVAQRLRLVALAGLDPYRLQAEGRVLAGDAVEAAEYLAGVDRQLAIGIDLRFGHADPHQGQAVGVGQQVEVVADVHRGHQEAQLLGQLLAYALDSRQQLPALVAVDQRDQPVADFQADHVHRGDIIPAQFLDLLGALRRQQLLLALHLLLGDLLGLVLPVPDPVGGSTGQGAEADEGNVRHARHGAHGDQDRRGNRQRLGRGEHLPVDLLAHVLGTGDPRHHDRRRGRQQQRRQLCHQAVTDGQQGVDLAGVAEGHRMLDHADGDAADQVDEENQQAGDGVTADELAGTVHRTVEVGLLGHLVAALLGFLLLDQAGVEVSVDGHLLAGHGIQGEARADFGNPPGALGHHHEVDDHEDREHHHPDHVVAADHHFAEGLDHLARGAMAVVAVEQHHAGRGNVQRQAQQGRHQQDGREHGEVQRPQGVHADQQDDDGQGDVEGEQHVQQEWRDRQGHHRQHGQQQDRHAEAAAPQSRQVAAHIADQLRAIHSRLPCPAYGARRWAPNKLLTPECASGGSLQELFQLFNSLIEKGFSPITNCRRRHHRHSSLRRRRTSPKTNWTNSTTRKTRNPMS